MITKAIKSALAELELAVKNVHAHCDAAGEHFNEAAHEVAHELVSKLWDVANEVDDKLHELLAKHHPDAIAQQATDTQERIAAEALELSKVDISADPPPAPGTEAALLAGDPSIPGVDDAPKPGTAMAPGSGVTAINEPIIPEATAGDLKVDAGASELLKDAKITNIAPTIDGSAVGGGDGLVQLQPGEHPINEALNAGAVAGAVPTPGENRAADGDGSNASTKGENNPAHLADSISG